MTRLRQLIDAIPEKNSDAPYPTQADYYGAHIRRRDAIIRAYHEALKQLHGASYYSNAPSEMEDADLLLARFEKEFGK